MDAFLCALPDSCHCWIIATIQLREVGEVVLVPCVGTEVASGWDQAGIPWGLNVDGV